MFRFFFYQRTSSQHRRRQAALSAPASSSVSEPITSPFHGSLQPSATPSGFFVVFQVHLQAVDPTGPEAQKLLLDWLLSLGAKLSIELLVVYKTKSTKMLFHVPWTLWARLDGLSGFELLCETTGRNLLSTLMSRIQSPASMAEP